MTAPDYIFSPDLYTDVRLPILEAGLLPPWCYTSREFYEREVREIFMKVWNLVGRVEQIPNPGDYIALELAGVPVIILRDERQEVRAFANTCRHRGCRLLTGEGSCDRYIKCPYHGWAYAFDGRLVGAPGMKETLDFDLSQIALHPIRLETWEGFMFICFDAQSEGLMDYLGDFPERFAMYCFGEMVLTRRKESVIECNWKLLTENAMEGYHTGTVHGGSLGRQELILEETRGQWVTAFHESGKSIATLPGETRSLPADRHVDGGGRRAGPTSCCSIPAPPWRATRMACSSSSSPRKDRRAPVSPSPPAFRGARWRARISTRLPSSTTIASTLRFRKTSGSPKSSRRVWNRRSVPPADFHRKSRSFTRSRTGCSTGSSTT